MFTFLFGMDRYLIQLSTFGWTSVTDRIAILMLSIAEGGAIFICFALLHFNLHTFADVS